MLMGMAGPWATGARQGTTSRLRPGITASWPDLRKPTTASWENPTSATSDDLTLILIVDGYYRKQSSPQSTAVEEEKLKCL